MFEVYSKPWSLRSATKCRAAACSHRNRVQEQVCGDRRTFAVGAVDWKTSQAGSLNVDVYQNDQDLLGDDYEPLKRIAKPIDRTLPSCIISMRSRHAGSCASLNRWSLKHALLIYKHNPAPFLSPEAEALGVACSPRDHVPKLLFCQLCCVWCLCVGCELILSRLVLF
jgi:hypothetical protein